MIQNMTSPEQPRPHLNPNFITQPNPAKQNVHINPNFQKQENIHYHMLYKWIALLFTSKRDEVGVVIYKQFVHIFFGIAWILCRDIFF